MNIVFFASPDPATDPRHRLNQADQHPDPLSSAQFLSNISPSDSSATLSTLRENNYLKQIFNYNTKDKSFSSGHVLFLFTEYFSPTNRPHFLQTVDDIILMW